MYYENEISDIRKTWCHYLASFVIGEQRVIDETDRKRLATSISNGFHKTKKARFTIFKKDGEVYCKRLA